MSSYSVQEYLKLLNQLRSYDNIPLGLRSSFKEYLWVIGQVDQQTRFSKPMPWIGMYIASASLFCIVAMVADLIHGLRNRKLWFPCKYFTLNAASLAAIAVAMKLPVDISDPMPGKVDQKAKIGSMAFMCTMMANLLPSLATMNGKELVTNMIALNVFVVTLVVNICIEIKTDVISFNDLGHDSIEFGSYNAIIKVRAAIYVVMLLMLLIVHTCSSLAILKSKQMLESKYQQVRETTFRDQHLGTLSVEKLKEHVSCYWIMAETGSPQFMIVSSATTIAAGVLCTLSTLLHITLMVSLIKCFIMKPDFHSSYKWSIIVIAIIQLMGVILGTIAPFFRCFTFLSFKMSTNLIWNHFKVFKVESYWTQKLSDWKQRSVPSPFQNRKFNMVLESLKIVLLNICVGFQKSVVVTCRLIALIPIFVVMCLWCCSCCWKWIKAKFSDSSIVLGKSLGPGEQNEDLRRYALQTVDDIELADRTLKGISKSLNRLIQRAEKHPPNNLMKLLKASRDFKGVGRYDNHHVSRLISEEYLDCWSLPLVTLTTIAISLPKIKNNIVDRLLRSVSEGLVYVRLVEEIINATDEYISTRKTATLLWPMIEFNHKWFGIQLRKLDPKLNKAQQILKWFRDTAKIMIADMECVGFECPNENSICRSVAANSMYRITETILLSYQNNSEEVSQRELFEQLESMISGILGACLTNLPRVIMRKCHTNEIEKREASVHVAAQYLGETMQIINILEDRELPSLNPDELAFIGSWCAYYSRPSP